MSIEKEYLAFESGVDYDEYTSDKNLDIRDCISCVHLNWGYFEDNEIKSYCLKACNSVFYPVLPFFCSHFDLEEK